MFKHHKEVLMKGRGITWYIIVSPIPKEKELEKIRKLILNHNLFQNDFEGVYLSLHDKVSDTVTWLKIRSPILANHMLRISEIHSYYKLVFDTLYEHIKNVLNKNNFKLLGFSFELNCQMYPEEPEGIIPMVELDLSKKKLDK